jgi:hypothetical protein
MLLFENVLGPFVEDTMQVILRHQSENIRMIDDNMNRDAKVAM